MNNSDAEPHSDDKMFNPDAMDWSAVYQTFGQGFLKYLYSTGLSAHDAEDILQESFLALWKSRAKVSAQEAICSYWFRIVKNKRADFYRKSKDNVSLDEAILIPDSSDSASAEMDLAYLRTQLTQAINKLPKEQAEAYRLCKISGFSIKEVATFQSVSEPVVKTRIFRARKKLMDSLKDTKFFLDFS